MRRKLPGRHKHSRWRKQNVQRQSWERTGIIGDMVQLVCPVYITENGGNDLTWRLSHNWKALVYCALDSRHDPIDIKESTEIFKQRAEMITLVLLSPSKLLLAVGKPNWKRKVQQQEGKFCEGRDHCLFYSLVPSTMPGTKKNL